ncbi:MAG: chlorophyll a/b-binding protein [Cyanobacteria bacterium J06638_28]
MEPDAQNLPANADVETPAVNISDSEPEVETTAATATPTFGWNSYAERINGRFAMVGFIALLILEFFTRQDFFTWLGF